MGVFSSKVGREEGELQQSVSRDELMCACVSVCVRVRVQLDVQQWSAEAGQATAMFQQASMANQRQLESLRQMAQREEERANVAIRREEERSSALADRLRDALTELAAVREASDRAEAKHARALEQAERERDELHELQRKTEQHRHNLERERERTKAFESRLQHKARLTLFAALREAELARKQRDEHRTQFGDETELRGRLEASERESGALRAKLAQADADNKSLLAMLELEQRSGARKTNALLMAAAARGGARTPAGRRARTPAGPRTPTGRGEGTPTGRGSGFVVSGDDTVGCLRVVNDAVAEEGAVAELLEGDEDDQDARDESGTPCEEGHLWQDQGGGNKAGDGGEEEEEAVLRDDRVCSRSRRTVSTHC